MMVPSYYPSRRGRVFRIHRRHERLPAAQEGQAPATDRFVLRAFLVQAVPGESAAGPINAGEPSFEVVEHVDEADVLDRLRRKQVVPTTEDRFERLWQQLRLELDAL